jgi:hypothetical protein
MAIGGTLWWILVSIGVAIGVLRWIVMAVDQIKSK